MPVGLVHGCEALVAVPTDERRNIPVNEHMMMASTVGGKSSRTPANGVGRSFELAGGLDDDVVDGI